MDIASFVATVTDPNLRREIFMNMDEVTIASLPPNLMAEARGVHDAMLRDQERRHQQALNQAHRMDAVMGRGGLYSRDMLGGGDEFAGFDPLGHRRLEMGRGADRHGAARERTLEESINIRLKQVALEC